MITRSTLKDLGGLLNLSKEFCDESDYRGTFNEDKVRQIYTNVINDPTSGMILHYEADGRIVGFLCAVKEEMMFSNKVNVTELAWYVTKEYRKSSVGPKLMKAIEYWAKEVVKADYITMIHLNTPRLGEYYEKSGYTKREEAYLKEL